MFHGFAGAELRALSAVEMALWDILGKSLNTPVFRLLGGPVRDRVSTYNTCIGHPPYDDYTRWHEDAGSLAQELHDQGSRGMKIWPFDSYSVRSMGQTISREEIEAGLEPVRSIRNAVGENFRIGIEMHFRWNRMAAEQIGYALEPHNIYFMEDVLPAVNYQEIKRLSQSLEDPRRRQRNAAEPLATARLDGRGRQPDPQHRSGLDRRHRRDSAHCRPWRKPSGCPSCFTMPADPLRTWRRCMPPPTFPICSSWRACAPSISDLFRGVDRH